jgi:hypothetical protein
MGAARRRRAKWRTSKFRRRVERSIKCLPASQPETMDDSQFVQVEETDRLLVSSLKFWEVERDLIEERMAAMNR